MTTIYEVVDLLNRVRATFVFKEDAEEFIRTRHPTCVIRPLSFDRDGHKRKGNDKTNTL